MNRRLSILLLLLSLAGAERCAAQGPAFSGSPSRPQKEMRGLTREAKSKLLKYAWPGNVRELQHTMERAVILGDGSLLRPENFVFQATAPASRPHKEEKEVLNLEQLERQAVERAMRLSEGNMTKAAEYLGITRFALYRKIEKLGL